MMGTVVVIEEYCSDCTRGNSHTVTGEEESDDRVKVIKFMPSQARAYGLNYDLHFTARTSEISFEPSTSSSE
jgi:hypothetical protein